MQTILLPSDCMNTMNSPMNTRQNKDVNNDTDAQTTTW